MNIENELNEYYYYDKTRITVIKLGKCVSYLAKIFREQFESCLLTSVHSDMKNFRMFTCLNLFRCSGTQRLAYKNVQYTEIPPFSGQTRNVQEEAGLVIFLPQINCCILIVSVLNITQQNEIF